jgi:hypothetical protein
MLVWGERERRAAPGAAIDPSTVSGEQEDGLLREGFVFGLAAAGCATDEHLLQVTRTDPVRHYLGARLSGLAPGANGDAERKLELGRRNHAVRSEPGLLAANQP